MDIPHQVHLVPVAVVKAWASDVLPTAVAVNIEGNLVGHLPRPAARVYRPIIEETIQRAGVATCRAEIRGGWERAHGDIGRFGVVVTLPRPPSDQ